MRHPRNLRAAPAIVSGSAPAIIADLRLRVVTPMFGGGVDAGINDPNHLIRPSAIRGQLRFWWRACNASHFPTLGDLHKAERALWGSAAKKNDPSRGPGTINLRVLEITYGDQVTYQAPPPGQKQPPRGWYIDGNGPIDSSAGYVLFPFTPNEKEESKSGTIGVTFRLQLTLAPHTGLRNWPDANESLAAARQALWAWIVFGGVGARTRRGCGTVRCEGEGDSVSDTGTDDRIPAATFQVDRADPGTWLRDGLDACLGAGPAHPTAVPSLRGCQLLVGNARDGSVSAWAAAIEPLQQFLQGEGIGRNRRASGSNRPGQSFWPEVGAARGLVGFSAKNDDHGHPYTQIPSAQATGKQFLRADLGLPRVMKLSSQQGATQVTLERNQREFTRMASPFILKALPISRNQAIPIVLLLDTPHIWDAPSPGLRLVGPGGPYPLTPVALNAAGATPTWPRTLPKHVGDPGIASVREAFLKYVEDDPVWKPVP